MYVYCNHLFLHLRVSEETLNLDRRSLEQMKYDEYILLDEFVMNLEGFYPFVNELVRDVFKFKRNYIEPAEVILQKINPNNLYTMVSIHLRLTDMDVHLQENWNLENKPEEYLRKAMRYFNDQYQVTFISIQLSTSTSYISAQSNVIMLLHNN